MVNLCKSAKLRPASLNAFLLTLVVGTSCLASVNVTLSPSVSSGAPVGTTVLWTAHATDTANSNATFVYQFKLGPSGGALQVRRDFYVYNTFPWTPSNSEGTYDIQVIARNLRTGVTGTSTAVFDIASRVSGGTPVVSSTAHPLVAFYSMPACPAGRTARVRFKLPTDSAWQSTSLKSCTGSSSLNFYVAGMRASTTYQLQHDVINGPLTTSGPVLSFKTGAIPVNLPIGPYSIAKPFASPNSTAYPVLLDSQINNIPYAIDASGSLVWYLRPPGVQVAYLLRPVDGGTFLVLLNDGFTVATHLVREYDLAGNIVSETNYAAISEQLTAHGADAITTLHHEAVRLPNGWTALIGSVEKVADQGNGPVDVLGDQVIVVDGNFQLKWWWNEFDHLDIRRKAILGETCAKGDAGCPTITNPNFNVANDWTHTNGLTLSPDGNMLVSSRHQDWVMKVRYQGGTGDGKLLYRLGAEGDFRTDASVPNPWFSHQHNPQVTPDGQLTLFDNGNTRVGTYGGNSRGQAWYLDLTNMVAHLVTNIDLGLFSMATGSAQLLSNGNFAFNLGYVGTTTYNKEFTASGVLESQQNSNQRSYRSFRMRSLYQEH